MTAQPEVVRQTELVNQLVINRDTMEELGRVETLWMYAPSHRVLGFICKSGFLGGTKLAFNLAQIHALGANGILTQAKPQETDGEKVRQLESVINCEVWSDSGEKVGKIIDYLFNLRTGEIAHYLLASSTLGVVTGEIYQLFPSQVLGIGRKRVLIPDYAVKNLSVYREGIKQKLSKAGEILKQDYGQVTQELQSLTQRAQEKTEQAKGRLRNLTEQWKQRAQELSQQAQETVQHLNEQWQEGTHDLVEQAQERSYTWMEQVREQTQTLSDQVEDGIQTLTVQAKEILDSDLDSDLDSEPDDNLKDRLDLSSKPTTREEPEDFFDALFGDDDDTGASIAQPSIAQPSIAQPSIAQPSMEIPADEASRMNQTAAPTTDVASTTDISSPMPEPAALEDDVWGDDIWDEDVWDIGSAPISQPPQPQPTSTTEPVKSVPPEEDDDEAWI